MFLSNLSTDSFLPSLQAAVRARDSGSTRFCMGAAWRGPSQVSEPLNCPDRQARKNCMPCSVLQSVCYLKEAYLRWPLKACTLQGSRRGLERFHRC